MQRPLLLGAIILLLSWAGPCVGDGAEETCDVESGGCGVESLREKVTDLTARLAKCEGESAAVGAAKDAGKEKKALVVAIITAPSNVDRRTAIRETWLSSKPANAEDENDIDTQTKKKKGAMPKNIAFQFYVGEPADDAQRAALESESALHGDMVLLKGVADRYDNLVWKIRGIMIHVAGHYKFKHFLKLDDDCYVRPKALSKLLRTLPTKRLYYGERQEGGQPHRHEGHKWNLPRETYFMRELPPYAHGYAYMLSADMVEYIVSNKEHLKPLALMDDISVALWMLALQVHPLHADKFSQLPSMSNGFGSRCNSKSVILGSVDEPGAMAALHKQVKAGKSVCALNK